jgi:hypothetical protein
LTKIPHDVGVPWYRRPGPLAVVAGIVCLALNFLFY